MNIYIETLGCARNQVDSELIIGSLKNADCTILDEPENADVIFINTCSFVEDAVNESIDTILYLAKYKTEGACEYLLVGGCLPERFREKMVPELPEVDLFLGTGALHKVAHVVKNLSKFKGCILPNPSRLNLGQYTSMRAVKGSPMAYLKIAEGCDKHCTYCIIPKLRGNQKSRPLNDIADEARRLIENDVKELVLVAQESTFYGKDLSPSTDISELIKRLSDLSENIWIRLLYGHPESVDKKLIKTIASRKNVCTYFDIPIQHAADSVLKRMGRTYEREDLFRLFDQIRSHIPDVALRTTVITGFPGESWEDFDALMDFIKKQQFHHLGAFMYSDFEDLPSHNLPNHVPEVTAKERYDQIMACQQEISLNINREFIGREMDVLIETPSEEDLLTGRTAFQAPEVDGLTYINAGRDVPLVGTFSRIKITDALEYDLVGEPI